MPYVHLLGLMVKLHNVILAMLMALLSVKHVDIGERVDEVSLGRVMFRAFFMPFLYNAILIINENLTDPFSGDITDFPVGVLVESISKDAQMCCTAGANLP